MFFWLGFEQAHCTNRSVGRFLNNVCCTFSVVLNLLMIKFDIKVSFEGRGNYIMVILMNLLDAIDGDQKPVPPFRFNAIQIFTFKLIERKIVVSKTSLCNPYLSVFRYLLAACWYDWSISIRMDTQLYLIYGILNLCNKIARSNIANKIIQSNKRLQHFFHKTCLAMQAMFW